MEFLTKIRKTVSRCNMLSGNDRILIGLSGGADSVCLAVILDKLKDDFNLDLHALYVDHGMRDSESRGEIDFCRRFCESRGISFHSERINVREEAARMRINLQETARKARYGLYDSLSLGIGATKIALGHSADDQAETVLMRLLGGAGRKGLSGIPPVRGRIIRPLIEAERKSIEEFLLSEPDIPVTGDGKPFVTDSSNLDEGYFRNWLRIQIMERLKERRPSVVKEIGRSSMILREEDEYLERIVTKTMMRLVRRKGDDSIELFLSPLAFTDRAVARRVLRRAVGETKGLRGLALRNIDDVLDLVTRGTSGDRLSLPGDIMVVKDYAVVKIYSSRPPKRDAVEYSLMPPCEYRIDAMNALLIAVVEDEYGDRPCNGGSVVLDADSVSFPLTVRSRASGDYFYPLGYGHRKKLQDYFVDEKVPRDERDRIPIILSGNDIIWIAGHRGDDRFRVTDRTARFLRLTMIKKDE